MNEGGKETCRLYFGFIISVGEKISNRYFYVTSCGSWEGKVFKIFLKGIMGKN